MMCVVLAPWLMESQMGAGHPSGGKQTQLHTDEPSIYYRTMRWPSEITMRVIYNLNHPAFMERGKKIEE